jgi:hypothetical protein
MSKIKSMTRRDFICNSGLTAAGAVALTHGGKVLWASEPGSVAVAPSDTLRGRRYWNRRSCPGGRLQLFHYPRRHTGRGRRRLQGPAHTCVRAVRRQARDHRRVPPYSRPQGY